MKLAKRELVDGSTPPIYIGHRVYGRADGSQGISSAWYAEYRWDGEQHFEALNEPNRNSALRKVWQIIDRLAKGQSKPVKVQMTWPELREEYMSQVRLRNRSPSTITKYDEILRDMVDFAAEREIRNVSKFTREDFLRFGKHLQEKGNEAKTCFSKLMFVKQVFKWLTNKGILSSNPLVEEHPVKPANEEQPCYTGAQVQALLSKASYSDHSAFAIMAYAGLRFGEVRDLRWKDLHLDRGKYGRIFVKRGGSGRTTKDRENRVIPIHPELRKILDKMPRFGERVFYEPKETCQDGRSDHPLSERKLLKRVKRTCKACGFENPDQYMLHTFRHAFASMCARNQVSYKYALEWMGHKSSDILDLYFKMYDDVAEQAMETIRYTS